MHAQTPTRSNLKRPSLQAALRLTCPYCGETPFRAPGSRWTFQRGCKACDYRFEREIGYFTGASWMVTFPLTAVLGLALAALGKLWLWPEANTLLVISLVSLVILLVAALSSPYCMAVWLYADHCLHPLNDNDSYEGELLN